MYIIVNESHTECDIVLSNCEKLCGDKCTIECVQELVKRVPDQIGGVKDRAYNLFENLEIDNFSILPGSESKLLKGLELGCTGIITAACNVTSALARKDYDDFLQKKEKTVNEKNDDVRNICEKYKLMTGLHDN